MTAPGHNPEHDAERDPEHAEEAARLDALRECAVLDTDPEDDYDDLTRLAAHLCGVPIALVSLVDAERQWFKSRLGLDASETHRDHSFCSHAIRGPGLMTVPDATLDPRFADNPLVTGDPNIRFYAGAPLVTEDGHALGSLCVIDRSPRTLTAEQELALTLLARLATSRLEMKRRLAAQAKLIAEWRDAQQAQARLAAIIASSEDAVIGTTLDGTIVIWNPGAERLYGLPPGAVIGRPASLLVPPGETGPGPDVVARLQRGEAVTPLEVTRTRPDGSRVTLSLSFSPIKDAAGRMVGLSCIARDVSARVAAEQAWRKSEEALRTVINGAPVVLYATDTEGTVTLSQGAGLARLGLTPGEVVGRSVFAMYGHVPGVADNLRRALAGEDVTYDSVVGGLCFHNDLRPRRDEAGRVTGVIAMAFDTTERTEAEEEVRRSQARLAEAQRVAKMGSWELNVATGRVLWSEQLFHLFGRDPALGEPSYPEAVALYHPDDAATLAARVAQAIQTGEGYDLDLRRGNTGGPTQWFNTVGTVVKDTEGRVVRLVGTLTDITERVASEERFRVLFEKSPDMHLLVDETGVIDCNPAAVVLLGCADKDDLLARHPATLSPEKQPDGRGSHETGLEMDRIAREQGGHRFEWTHRRADDGSEFPVEVTLTPVTLRDRPVLMAVCHDLTERKRAEQQVKDYAVVLQFQMGQLEAANAELEALATTDGLTELKNHRAFQERLSEETVRAERHATPLSLVMLDVDHFKQFNDAFGHPAGDAVLRGVAHVLRTETRETDIVARYGGEEFCLLLPQTDGAGAAVIAERIRRAVAARRWPLRPITASFGIATLSLGIDTSAALVARADRALYAAKAGGRDRVSCAPFAAEVSEETSLLASQTSFGDLSPCSLRSQGLP